MTTMRTLALDLAEWFGAAFYFARKGGETRHANLSKLDLAAVWIARAMLFTCFPFCTAASISRDLGPALAELELI